MERLEVDIKTALHNRAMQVDASSNLVGAVAQRVARRRRDRGRRRAIALVSTLSAGFMLFAVAYARVDDSQVVVASPPQPASPSTAPAFASVPRVAMFGGSMALETAFGLNTWGSRTRSIELVGGRTQLGCGISQAPLRLDVRGVGRMDETCRWPVTWQRELDGATPDVAVVQVGEVDLADQRLDENATGWLRVGDPIFDDYLRNQMLDATDMITSRGTTAVWLTLPPTKAPAGRDPRALRGAAADPARAARFNELIAELPRLRPNAPIAVIDLAGWLATQDDQRLRPDGVRFSPATAAEVADRWLGAALLDAYRQHAAVASTTTTTTPTTTTATSTTRATTTTVTSTATATATSVLSQPAPVPDAEGLVRLEVTVLHTEPISPGYVNLWVFGEGSSPPAKWRPLYQKVPIEAVGSTSATATGTLQTTISVRVPPEVALWIQSAATAPVPVAVTPSDADDPKMRCSNAYEPCQGAPTITP